PVSGRLGIIGTLTANVALTNNSGTVTLNSGGNLILNHNASSICSGTFNWNSGGKVTVAETRTFSPTNLNVASGSILEVLPGASLTPNGGLTLAGVLNNFGQFTLSGSTLNLSGTLDNSGTFTNNGTVNNLIPGLPFDNIGGVYNGSGQWNFTFRPAGGIVSPGPEASGAGCMNFDGAVELQFTTLVIEIGGTTECSQRDKIRIFNDDATATLNTTGGTVRIFLLNDFIPTVGQQFTIATANLIFGTLPTLVLPPGLTGTLSSNGINLMLTINTVNCPTETCNGLDDDCDGIVDDGFDQDNDGFTSCQNDCDDNDPAVHPNATETCNGLDDDCDGTVDNFLFCGTPGLRTWTGSVSTDWYTPCNWVPSCVPTADDRVTIPDVANDPQIALAATAKSINVQTGAVLTVAAAGTLEISGPASKGIENEGTVENFGTIAIGVASGLNIGIINIGTFHNKPGGLLQIDNCATTGIWNYNGTFINDASLVIGGTASTGNHGLFNSGNFSNNPGGQITIDRSLGAGLTNVTASIFSNSGSIVIGASASNGYYGIHNFADFSNNPGGQITIDRSAGYGVFNQTGTFSNAGGISIGETATVGFSGLGNLATFQNNPGGQITIDRWKNFGLLNSLGTFSNTGGITIGQTVSTGDFGIFNLASFNANACGKISLFAPLKNTSNCTNAETTFDRCVFKNNTCHNGSNIGTGGALQTLDFGTGIVEANFVNCLLDGNKALGTADDGGGAVMVYGGAVGFLNSTIVGSESATKGGAISIYNNTGAATAKNTIFWNNSAPDGPTIYNGNGGAASLEHALVQDTGCPPNTVCGAGLVFNSDPVFVSPTDFHLGTCSPAIDAGSDANAPSTDLDGNERLFQAIPGGEAIDLGAHEHQQPSLNGQTSCSISGPDPVCPNSTGNVYSAPAGMSAYSWSVSGNGTMVSSSTGSSVTVTAGAPGTFAAMVTVTDANGCTSSCSKTVMVNASSNVGITVSENSGAPNDGIVCSGTSATLTASGGGTYAWSTGVTTAAITVFPSTSTTYTVTVTAVDGCTATASQTITVNPVPSCSITGSGIVCPNSVGNVYSAPSGMSAYSWSVSGNGTMVSSSTGSSVTVTAGAPGSITATVTVTDANGCTAAAAQTIQVNTPPSCSVTGADEACSNSAGNVYSAPAGMSAYSWTVSGNGTMVSSSVGSSVTVTAGVPGTFTAMVMVTDANGCTSSCSKIVTVGDNAVPSITCPAPTTVSCAGDVPAVNLATVSVSDNCDTPAKSHVSDATSNQTCTNRKTVIRTYRATDASGNSATCSQVITVFDDAKPNFTSVPANVTVQCNSVPAVGSPSASDGCGGSVSIAYNSQTSAAGACPDSYTLTRQWTATDACGNTKTATQCITVLDTQKPNFTSTPVNITVQCSAVPSEGMPTATDNCDATVAITYNGQTQTAGTCANAYTLTRTWTAADNCGNTKTVTQRITVVDTGKPVFTSFPNNTSITCTENPPAVGNPAASDACGSATVTYLGQSTTSGTCPGNYQIKRTWRATDACGNTTAATQTIQVSDTGVPVFTSVPAAVTIECTQPLPPLTNPTASDACGGYVHITFLGNVATGSGCASDYTITRTWRATDLCGNTATTQQVITVKATSYGPEGAENRAGSIADATETQNPKLKTLTLQPNPTTDRVWIDLSDFASEAVTVSVFSDLGQLVWESMMSAVEDLKPSVSLREAGAAAGIYTVSVRSSRKVVAKRLVLVE
ncbi:MAG: MopE-related protein, partial [Saprospiraceae bacterium]